MNLLFLIEAIITLLIMINPMGVIPPYLSLTKELDKASRRVILRQAMIFASAILIACIFVGTSLLRILGISTFALQIAGGILFFKFGYEVMNGSLNQNAEQAPGLVPLGFPIIAGPGSITAIIVLSSQYSSVETYLVLAVILVLSFTFTLLYFAKSIVKLMGDDATTAIVKLMGLLIITIGIQLILAGIQAWVLSTPLTVN